MPRTDRILLLGGLCSDSILNALRVSGISYVNKLFSSSPKNWLNIDDLLRKEKEAGIGAALVQLSEVSLVRGCFAGFHDSMLSILDQLSRLDHLVLVYRSNLEGEKGCLAGKPLSGVTSRLIGQEIGGDDELELEIVAKRMATIVKVLNSGSLRVYPYSYKSDLTSAAIEFLDSFEKGLLLRLYIPVDHIYSKEIGSLIDLLQDYMSNLLDQSMSLEKRQTGRGCVYSIFSLGAGFKVDIGEKIKDLSLFLFLCANNPPKAVEILTEARIDDSRIPEIVSRYAREARRLYVDIEYERRSRLLKIEHELHAELLDCCSPLDTLAKPLSVDAFERIAGVGLAGFPLGWQQAPSPPPEAMDKASQIVWDNTRSKIESEEEKQAIEIIYRFSERGEQSELLSALQELKDRHLARKERQRAWGRVKTFFNRVSPALERTAGVVIERYLTSLIT